MTHRKQAQEELTSCSFSITQSALGSPLQFEPAMGSKELDDLINRYIPGTAAPQQKRAQVVLEFLNSIDVSSYQYPVSLRYPVPRSQRLERSLRQSPTTSRTTASVPRGDSGYGSAKTEPLPTSRSAGSLKRSRQEPAISDASNSKRLPGFSIMTRDGVDITDHASRGPKTKEQREHAALMRKLKACAACKRSKQRCDPSHHRPTRASLTPPSSTTPSRNSARYSCASSAGGWRGSISPQSSLGESFSQSPHRSFATNAIAYAGKGFSPLPTPKSALSPSDFALPETVLADPDLSVLPMQNLDLELPQLSDMELDSWNTDFTSSSHNMDNHGLWNAGEDVFGTRVESTDPPVFANSYNEYFDLDEWLHPSTYRSSQTNLQTQEDVNTQSCSPMDTRPHNGLECYSSNQDYDYILYPETPESDLGLETQDIARNIGISEWPSYVGFRNPQMTEMHKSDVSLHIQDSLRSLQPPIPHAPSDLERGVISTGLNCPPFSEWRSNKDPGTFRRSQILYQDSAIAIGESQMKGRCPNPDCGKLFKDLKAHMLTHQNQCEGKIQIVSWEDFGHTYGKNRHTFTNHRGTMICGFCPESGSAANKSFNRSDLFNGHLALAHGAKPSPTRNRGTCVTCLSTAPASYAPDASAQCAACSTTFSGVQNFYEHLDDCVLAVVQEEKDKLAYGDRPSDGDHSITYQNNLYSIQTEATDDQSQHYRSGSKFAEAPLFQGSQTESPPDIYSQAIDFQSDEHEKVTYMNQINGIAVNWTKELFTEEYFRMVEQERHDFSQSLHDAGPASNGLVGYSCQESRLSERISPNQGLGYTTSQSALSSPLTTQSPDVKLLYLKDAVAHRRQLRITTLAAIFIMMTISFLATMSILMSCHEFIRGSLSEAYLDNTVIRDWHWGKSSIYNEENISHLYLEDMDFMVDHMAHVSPVYGVFGLQKEDDKSNELNSSSVTTTPSSGNALPRQIDEAPNPEISHDLAPLPRVQCARNIASPSMEDFSREDFSVDDFSMEDFPAEDFFMKDFFLESMDSNPGSRPQELKSTASPTTILMATATTTLRATSTTLPIQHHKKSNARTQPSSSLNSVSIFKPALGRHMDLKHFVKEIGKISIS